MLNKTIHIVGGPTASGKSAHAIELCEKHDGVIINADSMQIYNDLGLLTAQPSQEDKEAHLHQLYGTLHPNQSCSAGNWREMVEPIIKETWAKGKIPIIVGGSGLYLKTLTDGLSPLPDIPAEIREATNQKQKQLGNPAFYDALKERDPIMADRLHPYHTARLIRAWEVIEATGKSLSEWHNTPPIEPPSDWSFDITLVMPEREVLYKRCNERFLWMIDNGVMEEIAEFNKKIASGEVNDTCLLANALGYKPLSAYQRGEMSKEDAIGKSQTDTRHYAKRQVTWFRHQVKKNKNVANITVLTS